MAQKEKIIEIYKEQEIVKSFDQERREFAYQRYKHKLESDFLKKNISSHQANKLKILDVACGTGRMLPEVFKTKKEVEYTGLDTSKEMMTHLKNQAKKLGRNVDVVVSDASKMPFQDNTFDIVYTYHLLWHIPQKDHDQDHYRVYQ